jgi:hypothetical protein
LALAHAGLGEDDRALDWREEAVSVRDVHLIDVPLDPKWDRLQGHPRFQALLERGGLSSAPWRGAFALADERKD